MNQVPALPQISESPMSMLLGDRVSFISGCASDRWRKREHMLAADTTPELCRSPVRAPFALPHPSLQGTPDCVLSIAHCATDPAVQLASKGVMVPPRRDGNVYRALTPESSYARPVRSSRERDPQPPVSDSGVPLPHART